MISIPHAFLKAESIGNSCLSHDRSKGANTHAIQVQEVSLQTVTLLPRSTLVGSICATTPVYSPLRDARVTVAPTQLCKAMRSPSIIRGIRPLKVSSLFIAFSAIGFSGPSFATTTCTVPPELKAKLRSEPTAQMHADIGNWFAESKKFGCAASSFALASKLAPTSAAYKYFWGLSLSSAGRPAEALAPLRTASALDPSDIRPHLTLGAALDGLKRTGEAEEEWRSALAIDADSDLALDNLSRDLVNQKDFRSVVRLLDNPSKTRQRSTMQSLNLGLAYAGLLQLDDAVRVLREGLNTDPASLPIADELAMILLLQSKAEEAFPVFELALAKHPEDLVTRLLYLRALTMSHSDKAPQLAQTLLATYPNQWEVLFLNAQLASTDGEFQKALSLCSRSVTLNPDNPQSQRLLGSTLSRFGRLREAKEHLQRSIALGNTEPEVHYELARVLLGLGDSDPAQDQMREFQRLKNAQSEKTQAAGKAEEADQATRQGDAQKAVELYQDALASDPNEPLLYYKLAKALEKINDVAGETSALKRAIDLNPELPEAQNQLGYLALREGNSAEAEQHFRAAVHASPSYVVAWINLAATLAAESRWKDAEDAVNRALEIDPENVQARKLKELIATASPQR